jgi:hypothetical protein
LKSRSDLWQPVERLRRIWTPEREVYEIIDKIDPGSAVDSVIRELFSRMVKQVGAIQLDVTDPVDGFIRWEVVRAGPRQHVVSVWWTPEPDSRGE